MVGYIQFIEKEFQRLGNIGRVIDITLETSIGWLEWVGLLMPQSISSVF
jgi:hypothetical protein